MSHSLSLRNKILYGLDLTQLQGVEIGPLMNPLVTKSEGNIQYVDRASTAEIKKWYANNETVDVEKIVSVDYVWGKHSLAEAIGENDKFDYCIAAHVIEHVPDLIGWLHEISEILCDNGIASFSIPDRRYTFDYLRTETVAADLLDAYLQQAKQPSIRHIFDHFSLFTEIDILEAWSDDFDGKNLKPVKDPQKVKELCEEVSISGKYIDSHCWVFTAQSFLNLLNSLSEIGLLDFQIKRFFHVEYRNFEFVIQLEKLPPSLSKEEKRTRFLESCKKSKEHILRIQLRSFPAGEAQMYYDAGKGFNEPDSRSVSFSSYLKKVTLEFHIPPVNLKKLRFDPVQSAALFKIYSIELLLFGEDHHTLPLDSILPGEQLRFSKSTKNSFTGISYRKATDPHVIIPLPEDIKKLLS